MTQSRTCCRPVCKPCNMPTELTELAKLTEQAKQPNPTASS
ncbi:MAG: hypothetical protein R2857_12690 [Vampirovibrionales bacterium]